MSRRTAAPLRAAITAVDLLRSLPPRLFKLSPYNFKKAIRAYWIIRKSQCFDDSYYLRMHKDVAQSKVDPLWHYVLSGASEQRDPNPFFNTTYYLEQYADVFVSGLNPFVHYLLHGEGEFRNPSPQFNVARYLDLYPDVAQSGIPPLAHFIRFGKGEGRMLPAQTTVATEEYPLAEPPQAPREEEWGELIEHRKSAATSQPIVDIIIPVYRGFDETLRCIYRALNTPNITPYELIVINDNGPDAELTQELDRLAALGLFSLYHNERNLGFVSTVNFGMGLHPDRDVILLNSDTEVFGDWLGRLRQVSRSRPNVGTVTPLSNNATLCSYPYTFQDNDMLLELNYEALDALASTVNAGSTVEIPTAVGFCMYIRRECLAEVGPFDVQAFGLGYGEENDFCLRASRQGWVHLLAGDTFVRHIGSTSFQGKKQEQVKHALRVLEDRYPDYGKTIQDFVKRDPAFHLRRNLDLARLERASVGKRTLFVTHHLGGGTERHVRELSDTYQAEGECVIFLRPSTRFPQAASLSHSQIRFLPSLERFGLESESDDLADVLQALEIHKVHVHHLAGFQSDGVEWMANLIARIHVKYEFTVHDYTPICPRTTLIDETAQYCGEPPVSKCEECIQKNGSAFGRVSVNAWRAKYEAFLSQADRIWVPNEDVATRLQTYFPDVRFIVQPHQEVSCLEHPLALPLNELEVLRVAIIGAIGQHKGSAVLLECAKDALRRALPIHFVVIGFSNNLSALACLPNVTVTGPYQEGQLLNLLEENACHISFFPAVLPETYSYTLSTAFQVGLMPVSFDLGAIASRIKEKQFGAVLPIEWIGSPGKVNDYMLSLRQNPKASISV